MTGVAMRIACTTSLGFEDIRCGNASSYLSLLVPTENSLSSLLRSMITFSSVVIVRPDVSPNRATETHSSGNFYEIMLKNIYFTLAIKFNQILRKSEYFWIYYFTFNFCQHKILMKWIINDLELGSSILFFQIED